MNYEGKLYGRMDKKYFYTGSTGKDVDDREKEAFFNGFNKGAEFVLSNKPFASKDDIYKSWKEAAK